MYEQFSFVMVVAIAVLCVVFAVYHRVCTLDDADMNGYPSQRGLSIWEAIDERAMSFGVIVK
jgi:hypothetical protein